MLDRQWMIAIIWTGVAFTLAVFGIIHVPEAGFDNFSEPTPEQCKAGPDGELECWDHAEQWMFVVAYAMLAATFGVIFMVSKYDKTIEAPIDDESISLDSRGKLDMTLGGISEIVLDCKSKLDSIVEIMSVV